MGSMCSVCVSYNRAFPAMQSPLGSGTKHFRGPGKMPDRLGDLCGSRIFFVAVS